jgi:hypothetical protein
MSGVDNRHWKRSDVTDEQVIRACIEAHGETNGSRSLENLMATTGAPEKVCAAAMQRTCDRGLINYGVSLATAWAEPQGRDLLTSASSGC